MTAAFKAALPSTTKFVLVALCDNANDQGECYPSISMLCEKTSLSERAVQGAINALVAQNFMRRDIRNGRSTYYFISKPDSWPALTPAPRAPRTTCTPQELHPTPAGDAPPPPHHVHPTPAPRAPITIIEPSIEPSLNQNLSGQAALKYSALDDLLLAGVEKQIAEDWLEVRKAKKAKNTKTGISGVLSQIAKTHLTANDGIRLCCERNWVGFDPAWLPNARGSPVSTKPAKFDPLAYVNRNRLKAPDERTIDLDTSGNPILAMVQSSPAFRG